MKTNSEPILVNPGNPCPPELLSKQVGLAVVYMDCTDTVRSGVIEAHRDVAAEVHDFFALAFQLQFPIEKVVRASDPAYLWDDDKLMADNATSGFNYRYIPGTGEMSLHAQGRAFDVNTRLNPYITYQDGDILRPSIAPPGATWTPEIPGTLYEGHQLVVLMKERGWEWGGDWTPESGRVDYQHFQKT